MRQMQMIATVLMLPAAMWAGCSDGQLGRSPTDPALDARSAGASFSRDGDDGDRDDGGSKFRLFGDARMTRDPENPHNVVLEVNSDGLTAVGASRSLRRVRIWQLDHQLSFHRAFVAPHSCAGNSPRIQLIVDADGDGKFKQAPNGPDFVAHGAVRPPHTGCETSMPTPANGSSPSTLLWRFEDLTDELGRWSVTPATALNLPQFPFAPWDAFETAVATAFPNHRVLRASLLEDFNPTPPGRTYYDLITIYDLTLGTEGQTRASRDDDRDNDDHERDDR